MASAEEHNGDERDALSARLDAIVEQLMALERELQEVARELASSRPVQGDHPGELAVSITDEEPRADAFVVEPHQ